MKTPEHESESVLPRAGWILYDGGCRFCFRWVHLWKEVVARRGFALKDLQSASAYGSLQVSPENLLDDILVMTRAEN
jgi:predicted DCC family thiol-disulfide oxidoreductase YuxK